MTDNLLAILIIIGFFGVSLVALVVIIVRYCQYQSLVRDVLAYLGMRTWEYTKSQDEFITVKSAKAVVNFTPIKYFKDDKSNLDKVSNVLARKRAYSEKLKDFLAENEFKNRPMYSKLEKQIQRNLLLTNNYYITVFYSSPAGKSSSSRSVLINEKFVNNLLADPSFLMTKTEYNKMVKEQNKDMLDKKHHEYYEMVNSIIDSANAVRDKLVINGDQSELDRLVSSLFDKTVNSIKKIKTLDSEEWDMISKVINEIKGDVDNIIQRNQKIIDYYDSADFKRIKESCRTLMESQREFNEYINEKAQAISSLFGARVVRNETVVNDEYNYIRPYKKSITPFTAEVSSTVFASAENNPLDYVVKYFYPTKSLYPDQIRKLQLLVEELETLKDAKQIIENNKKDYKQYITGVPAYVMNSDEDGFYSRLGFANISESVLTVDYKFSYTSDGGFAQRSFTIPMTEETIVSLIQILQSKLTMSAFAQEQRNMMTSKLRQHIKERDNFTCKICGNSTHIEPNLLLEIDHIVPVSKGGCTVEDNLQTLCWKCNRSKSNKML